MRFGLVSGFGCSLSVALRLADEGHDVLTWHDYEAKNIQLVGKGLTPIESSYDRFMEWCHDEPSETTVIFDASGMGERADEAAKSGLTVMGGGTFCDKLEKDRRFGTKIAQDAGCLVPPYEEFASLSECREWAKGLGDTPCYFKSDRYIDADATYGAKDGDDLYEYLEHLSAKAPDRSKCIVQQKIDGVPFSTGQWWNGRSFVGPFENTIEHKKFMDGEVGPSTGCSFNALWFTPTSTIAEKLGWGNLVEAFVKYQAPPGLYDINAVIDKDGEAWFLEWTPRFGYDSEPTGFRLYNDLGGLFELVSRGTGVTSISSDLSYAVRLSVEPYPWEFSDVSDKHNCVGVPVRDVDDLHSATFVAYQIMQGDDGLAVASSEGIVGLSIATGPKLAALHDTVLDAAKTIRCPGLQFRTDGAKYIAEDADAIAKAGHAVHPGLGE